MRKLVTLGSPTVAVGVLAGLTGLYYLLVAINNTFDWGTNFAFVDHVFAMDTTFRDPDLYWRRIESDVVVTIAYVAIIVWEYLTGLILLLATVRAIQAGLGKRPAEEVRRLATLGWSMGVLLFGAGFIVIGGEWFAMWQSQDWNGLTPAVHNFLIAGVGLVLANLSQSTTSHEG